jgi:predicted RNase H-like HicB family nuclease
VKGYEIITQKYLVVYEKARDNYSAYSPDIPGCIATGKTRKETGKNIKEAINLHIDGLKEDGLPLPEPVAFIDYVEV